MQIRFFQVLATGGMACLMVSALSLNSGQAQEPVPEPTGGPVTTNSPQTTSSTVVSEGYVGAECNGYGYGGGNGHRRRYLSDYRRRYCRPEPFSRNDCRDQYINSQQGYGVPVTVPLAPVVCKQYNYGWGLPSSRLTHVPFGWQMTRPTAVRGQNSPAMVYWPTDTMQQGAYYMRSPW